MGLNSYLDRSSFVDKRKTNLLTVNLAIKNFETFGHHRHLFPSNLPKLFPNSPPSPNRYSFPAPSLCTEGPETENVDSPTTTETVTLRPNQSQMLVPHKRWKISRYKYRGGGGGRAEKIDKEMNVTQNQLIFNTWIRPAPPSTESRVVKPSGSARLGNSSPQTLTGPVVPFFGT